MRIAGRERQIQMRKNCTKMRKLQARAKNCEKLRDCENCGPQSPPLGGEARTCGDRGYGNREALYWEALYWEL